MSLQLVVANNFQTIEDGTFHIQTKLDERDRFTCTIADRTQTALFTKFQAVSVYDTVAGQLFTGFIDHAKPLNIVPDPYVHWDTESVDNTSIADRVTSNDTYTGQYAGNIVLDQYQKYLQVEGVIANYARAFTSTDTDWATGTLTGTVAGTTTGDGDLELGPTTTLSAIYNSTAQWNTGTYSSTQANSNGDISLIGFTRNWDNNDKSNQTLYGNGSPSDSITNGAYYLFCTSGSETRSRQDYAGTWQNGTIEVDLNLSNSTVLPGFTFRTTNWGNNDSTFAYAVELSTAKIEVRQGSNSSGSGSSSSVASHSFSTHLSHGIYRVRVILNGTSIKVSVNGTQYINTTDSSYGSAGYIALRNRNPSGAGSNNEQFDNFGVMSAETGTWISAGQALGAVTTIAKTLVRWDESLSQGGTIKVETSVDNGTSYQIATNGGNISGLVIGGSGVGKTLKIRVTLTTTTTATMPDIKNLQWFVFGGYVTTGTRISPALDLTPVGRAGNTSLSWNAIVPTNTTLGMDVSTDGGANWTDMTGQNGGPLPGINGTPEPTQDTFPGDTSVNYTSTNETGGANPNVVYDTANSRLLLSGGANGLYLDADLIANNVDLFADTDLSDAGGLVWCCVDSSNFYLLRLADNSASTTVTTSYVPRAFSGTLPYASTAGAAASKATLYKVQGVTQTQLAQTTIAWTRGKYVRFRATMLDGVITVTMDGVQIISYTDGSPLGAGLAGLYNNGGVTGSRFYQLWIAPQGDNLTGVQVLTRQRLDTTDQLVSPQVLDMTVTASDPNIGIGTLVPQVAYPDTFISANLADLAQKSDYSGYIDGNNQLIFSSRAAKPAPWILDSKDVVAKQIWSLQLEYSGDTYSNRQVLTGVVDVATFHEIHPGDGQSTSFSLQFRPTAPPIIKLNGQPVSVGMKGLDTGKAWYYALGDVTIAQDTNGVVLLGGGVDMLDITGTGSYTTTVTRDNEAGQAAVKAAQGGVGTGIVTNVTDVSSLGLNIAAAQAYGDILNARYARSGRTVTFTTWKPGLVKGQLLAAFIPERQVQNAQLLITSVDIAAEAISIPAQPRYIGRALASTLVLSTNVASQLEYTVVATELSNPQSWAKQLAAIVKS